VRSKRYDYMKSLRNEWKSQGLCIQCGINQKQENSVICISCKIRTKQNAVKRRKEERELVFNHYGRNCVCCYESTFELLTIDHINNDGKEHRKQLNNEGGEHFYRWLIKNNFPEGFQTLCWNCNVGKRLGRGICPHLKNVMANIIFLPWKASKLNPQVKSLSPLSVLPAVN